MFVSAGSVIRPGSAAIAVGSCVVGGDTMPTQRWWWNVVSVNITGAATSPARPAIAQSRDTSASDAPCPQSPEKLWTVLSSVV